MWVFKTNKLVWLLVGLFFGLLLTVTLPISAGPPESAPSFDNKVGGSGGSGDVTGPGTSVDNTIARFNGTGNTIDDSSCTIDDSDNMAIPGDLAVSGHAYITEQNLGTVGATETIDWTAGNRAYLVLDENLTISFTDPTQSTSVTMWFLQDGSGTNTVTFPAKVWWASGTAPTITADADATSVVSCAYSATADQYVCSDVLDAS